MCTDDPRVPFWPNDADSRKLYFLSTKGIHFYERMPQCTPLAGVVTSYVERNCSEEESGKRFFSFFPLLFALEETAFLSFFLQFIPFIGQTRIATISLVDALLAFKSYLDQIDRLNND